MGFRVLWLDQTENIDYAGQSLLNNFHRSVVSLKNDIYGIGGKAGTELRMVVPYGFSLFGNLFISLLSSKFKVIQTETVTYFAAGSFFDALDVSRKSQKLLLSSIEYSIGAKWGTSLGKRSYIDFHIGFEQQYFFKFNQNDLLIAPAFPSGVVIELLGGNLGIHGLVAGGSLYF